MTTSPTPATHSPAPKKCPDCFGGLVPVFKGDCTGEENCPRCKGTGQLATTPSPEQKMNYYLIQQGDGGPDVLHSFATPQERDVATMKLIFGEEISTQDEAEQWDKYRQRFIEDGEVTFEGDPGLSWFTAIPDAAALQSSGCLKAEGANLGLTHPRIHVDYYAWLGTLRDDFSKKFIADNSRSFQEFNAIAMWAWSQSRETLAKSLPTSHQPAPSEEAEWGNTCIRHTPEGMTRNGELIPISKSAPISSAPDGAGTKTRFWTTAEISELEQQRDALKREVEGKQRGGAEWCRIANEALTEVESLRATLAKTQDNADLWSGQLIECRQQLAQAQRDRDTNANLYFTAKQVEIPELNRQLQAASQEVERLTKP